MIKRNANGRRERGIFERPKNSGIWWVRYADEQGRLHREKVGPKALAQKVYQKRKTEIQERRFFPEHFRRREITLADAIDDYLARIKGRLRSYRDYARNGARWKAIFPAKTLRQILPGDIERYVAKRITEVAPASVNRELAFLKRLFNVAIADGNAETNPVRAVKLLQENNQRVRFLTEGEEEQLRRAIGEEQWPAVAFALNTGLRKSEQFTLRWEHVDFNVGVITSEIPRHSSRGSAARAAARVSPRSTCRTTRTESFCPRSTAQGSKTFTGTTCGIRSRAAS
jgi:integrase